MLFFSVFVICLLIGVPIAFSMGLAGLIYLPFNGVPVIAIVQRAGFLHAAGRSALSSGWRDHGKGRDIHADHQLRGFPGRSHPGRAWPCGGCDNVYHVGYLRIDDSRYGSRRLGHDPKHGTQGVQACRGDGHRGGSWWHGHPDSALYHDDHSGELSVVFPLAICFLPEFFPL